MQEKKNKLTLLKPDYDIIALKLNQKWSFISENASKDLTRICHQESVRIYSVEHSFYKMYKIFSEAFDNYITLFKKNEPKEVPEAADLNIIKKKNEFSKRVITGFPLSWFDTGVQEKLFKEEMDLMVEREISSPFYDM